MARAQLSLALDQDTANSLYVPGSIVSGSFTVEVNKPKDFRQIGVCLKGKGHVTWAEGGGTRFYSNETYADNNVILWNCENSPDGTLPAGRHIYPFQFTLPPNCPASFRSNKGKIGYTIEGVVLTKQFRHLKIEHPLSVLNMITANGPNFQQPVRVQKQKTVGWWVCKSGEISLDAQVERSGFNAGEEIPLSYSVENGSGRQITVRCELVETVKQTGLLHGSSGVEKQITSIRRVGISYSEPISPHTTSGQQFVRIPTPIDLRPAITRSNIIKSEYSVNVTLVIPWAFDSTISLPVVIGNTTADSVTNHS